MDKKDNSSTFINMIRGVACFLMLWGHCIQHGYNTDAFFENKLFKFIYSFHMPLFMLISGYCFSYSFNKRNRSDLILYKVKTLLHPILVFTFIDIIITKYFRILISGNWISNTFNIWFLWSVLYSSVIIGFIFKLNINFVLKVFISVFSIFLLIITPEYHMNIFMFPYFLIGFLYSILKEKIDKNFLLLRYLTIPIYIYLFNFYNYDSYIYTTGIFRSSIPLTETIKIDLYRYVIGLFGSIGIITVLYDLLRVINNYDFPFFVSLGKNSLQIYLLQRIFVERIYVFFLNEFLIKKNIFLYNNIILYNMFYTPILAFVFSLVFLILIIFLKRIKISRFIFGR